MKAKKIFFILFLFILGCGPSNETSDPFWWPANEPNIINGTIGTHNQFPSIVALVRKSDDQEHCTGTLIKPDLILTAAHCVYNGINNLYGLYRIDNVAKSRCSSCVLVFKDADVHPEYTNLSSPWNDIGLILLMNPVENPSLGTLLPLELDHLVYIGNVVIIAGYGRTENNKIGQLMYSEVPITDIYNPEEIVLGENNVNEPNACFGDSGGPAYFYYENVEYVDGVTSRVPEGLPPECGHGAVFSRPSKYIDWIEEAYTKMKNSSSSTISSTTSSSVSVVSSNSSSSGIGGSTTEDPSVISPTQSCDCRTPSSKNNIGLLFATILIFTISFRRKLNN